MRILFFLAEEPLPGLFSMSHTQLLTHPSSPITQASSDDTRYHDCNVSRERFQRTSTPKLTPMSFSHSAQKQVHSLRHRWVVGFTLSLPQSGTLALKKARKASINRRAPAPPAGIVFFFLYINTCCLKKITHNASKQDYN